MRRLFRTLGLVVTLGLVSFATVDVLAWPYEDYNYDTCYYTCSDGNIYQAYTTYSDCCRSTLSGFWCPPGETPGHPANAWGGGYHILESC
jgi:hypothetical protein